MSKLFRSVHSVKQALFAPQGFKRGLLEPSSHICNFSAKSTAVKAAAAKDAASEEAVAPAAKGKKKPSPSENESADEKIKAKKDLALQQAIDQITASFGKDAVMWLGRSGQNKSVPVVATGSFSLDLALGIGGLPKGRVVEIYGPEASGKTTLALHIIAEAQKKGDYCVFIDAEHALDPALAKIIGVKTENVLLSQPDSGEQALSLVDVLIRSGSVDVIVVDSVAALVPKGELDGEMGDAHMAMQARLMSQALRKLSHSLSASNTLLVFINQVRAKLGITGFGGPSETTCGGNALKFYASVRLNIKRIGSVKKGEEIIGNQVQIKIVKNKHAPPFRVCNFELIFGKGISRESELVDLGLKHKFVTKAAAMYTLGEKRVRGAEALKLYLANNDDVREELAAKLKEKLMSSNPEEDEPETTDEDEDPAAVEA